MRLGLALDLGSNEKFDPQLDRAKKLFDAAEPAGFESIWLGESFHDKPEPFHLPAPLITLAHLGAFTKLRLGTGVLLLRAYNVRKLAYEAALVDQLTGGRLTLGVGLGDRGISTRLGEGRLAPDFFDDGLSILREAWREPGGPAGPADGRHLAPLPLQRGGPKILVGGQGTRAVRRAAAHGDGYFAATSYSDDLLRIRAREYRDRCEDGGGEVCVNRLCVVRESRSEARRVANSYLGPVTTFYAKLGVWGLGPDGTADDAAGVVLAGSPRDVASRLAEYEDWGVTGVHLRLAPVGMPAADAIETIELIGDELRSRA